MSQHNFKVGQKFIVIQHPKGDDFVSKGRTVGSIVIYIRESDDYSFKCMCLTPGSHTESWNFSPNQLRPLTPLEELL